MLSTCSASFLSVLGLGLFFGRRWKLVQVQLLCGAGSWSIQGQGSVELSSGEPCPRHSSAASSWLPFLAAVVSPCPVSPS